MILRTFDVPESGPAWVYRRVDGTPIELSGNWSVKFIDGGPALPPPIQTAKLASWTGLGGPDAQSFAGTALYSLTFPAPGGRAGPWSLDLGKVCQSARVRLNGQPLGTVFTPPFRVPITTLLPEGNVLEVEVTNVSANRVRDLDIRHVPWKSLPWAQRAERELQTLRRLELAADRFGPPRAGDAHPGKSGRLTGMHFPAADGGTARRLPSSTPWSESRRRSTTPPGHWAKASASGSWLSCPTLSVLSAMTSRRSTCCSPTATTGLHPCR